MKGICFKEELFHAVVNGTKTQTRRIIKPRLAGDLTPLGNFLRKVKECWNLATDGTTKFKPRYKVGDIVYLKEPYFDCQNIEGLYYDLYKYAGHELPYTYSRWGNKLFMPSDKARYFIEITAVRAERLQDISESDCKKEGIFKSDHCPGTFMYEIGGTVYSTPQKAYAALIDKINGKGTWDSNPFVWVYDFELLTKN